MKIVDHFLCRDDGTPYPFEDNPNYDRGRRLHACDYLVLHFTGGLNIDSTINTFKNENAKVSAHLLIGRDGSVIQFVPFDTIAWHAGFSRWAGCKELNRYSIGIELDNFGHVDRNHQEQWVRGDVILPDDQVIEAQHRMEYRVRGWQIFTDIQLAVALEIAQTLHGFYDFLDVIGHEDIAIDGNVGDDGLLLSSKPDPGPAFPMARFRADVLGLQLGASERFITIQNLTVRSRPNDLSAAVQGGYLKHTTPVLVREQGPMGWVWVSELSTDGEPTDIEGWLPQRYLRRVRPVPQDEG